MISLPFFAPSTSSTLLVTLVFAGRRLDEGRRRRGGPSWHLQAPHLGTWCNRNDFASIFLPYLVFQEQLLWLPSSRLSAGPAPPKRVSGVSLATLVLLCFASFLAEAVQGHVARFTSYSAVRTVVSLWHFDGRWISMLICLSGKHTWVRQAGRARNGCRFGACSQR